MDDYGVPSSVEGRRYNVGLVSEWYDCGVDSHSFLALLKPGDLVEFKREAYCHWAVYIGDHTLPSLNTAGDDEDFLVLPCVVHRANPTDSENIQAMFSTSRSLAKGVHGIGAVVKEPLRDVWSRSEARINNGMDTTVTPFPSETGEYTEYTEYRNVLNLLTLQWCSEPWLWLTERGWSPTPPTTSSATTASTSPAGPGVAGQ